MIIVRQLIDNFILFINNNPGNKHAKFISHKVLKRYRDSIDHYNYYYLIGNIDVITKSIRTQHDLKSRTLVLFWRGVAYALEYNVNLKILPDNPLKDLLPKNPQSGSLLY